VHKAWKREKLGSDKKWTYSDTYGFSSFKDLDAYIAFAHQEAPAKCKFYEQARRNFKAFLDLDGGTKDDHEKICDLLVQFYKDVVGRDLADTPDWAAPLDGSRGDKISTHLVINDGYYFETGVTRFRKCRKYDLDKCDDTTPSARSAPPLPVSGGVRLRPHTDSVQRSHE
jgi:hypothetical protein